MIFLQNDAHTDRYSTSTIGQMESGISHIGAQYFMQELSCSSCRHATKEWSTVEVPLVRSFIGAWGIDDTDGLVPTSKLEPCE